MWHCKIIRFGKKSIIFRRFKHLFINQQNITIMKAKDAIRILNTVQFAVTNAKPNITDKHLKFIIDRTEIKNGKKLNTTVVLFPLYYKTCIYTNELSKIQETIQRHFPTLNSTEIMIRKNKLYFMFSYESKE